MKFFIGLVPDEEIYAAVANIQKEFGDNRVEPHITLRPPALINKQNEWLFAIEKVCSGFASFTVKLPATGNFGKRVLFIDVSSEKLHQLYRLLTAATEPFEQLQPNKQDNQNYNPHLTLARAWCGFSKNDFAEMKVLADNFLSQKETSFIANSIRIYHKPNGTGRYEPMKDIPLSASA